ncbi:hypothetical protein EDB81DRAFT_894757 [Dactylonectria macrodidyma]|uniref:Chromo domain-containing protein n=1 Tax=Dactylonectria macrodidyma TaxID=307937 RepID=A0A9P9D110_9HYPO|nr:hypothetical protein EDB81DRAFT_894757 [Dactylonectria macrodidyma]
MSATFPAALCDDESSNRGKFKTYTQGTPMLVANRDRVEPPKGDATDGSDDDEDEVDDELEDEFFIVKTIKKHYVDGDGALKFLVQWEGYESKKDWTWEPEGNLKVSGEEILNEYFNKIGGRHKIFKESDKAVQTRKRRRATNSTTNTTAKRLQGNEAYLADKTSPATVKNWSPPSGSWEDEIETIDACEDGGNGKLVVFLIWKNGEKTKHVTKTIYKKCPQKMLQFYERHVKIIGNENKALGDGAGTF